MHKFTLMTLCILTCLAVIDGSTWNQLLFASAALQFSVVVFILAGAY